MVGKKRGTTLRARLRLRFSVTNPGLGAKHLRRKPLVVEYCKMGHQIWRNPRKNRRFPSFRVKPSGFPRPGRWELMELGFGTPSRPNI